MEKKEVVKRIEEQIKYECATINKVIIKADEYKVDSSVITLYWKGEEIAAILFKEINDMGL